MEKQTMIEEQNRIEEQKRARLLLYGLFGELNKPYSARHSVSLDGIAEKINEGDIYSRWETESDNSLRLRGDVDDLTNAPECQREECYNYAEGKCVALENNDFGHRECPFFAPYKQVHEKQKQCLRRLLDEGREDLIERYGDQLAELGIVDLGDLGLEKMFSGLSSIEQGLAKKAESTREMRKMVDPDMDDSDDSNNPEDYDAIWAWREDDAPSGTTVYRLPGR